MCNNNEKNDEAKAKRLLKDISQAIMNKDYDRVDRLLSEKEAFLDTLDQKDIKEFNQLSSQLNAQFDQMDQAMKAFLGSDDTNQDEVDQLIEQVRQEELNKLIQSMPDVPTYDPKNIQPKQTTPQPQKPAQQTEYQQNEAERAKLRAADAAKLAKYKQQKEYWDKVAKKTQAQIQNQTPSQPKINNKQHTQTKPSTPPKKDVLEEWANKKQKRLREIRQESIKEIKDDMKHAYKAIGHLLNKIFEAKKKAPELEKKLSHQDKQVIEQSIAQLDKPDTTPKQKIMHTEVVLKKIENPSEPQSRTTQNATLPEQGWLGRVLDRISLMLTTLKNTLGFKSAKEDLQETINEIDIDKKNDHTHEQEEPDLAEDKKQEPPSSGF